MCAAHSTALALRLGQTKSIAFASSQRVAINGWEGSDSGVHMGFAALRGFWWGKTMVKPCKTKTKGHRKLLFQ